VDREELPQRLRKRQYIELPDDNFSAARPVDAEADVEALPRKSEDEF
jgi:hypothetical protein